jgi:Delta7-sterol 5-desaturase
VLEYVYNLDYLTAFGLFLVENILIGFISIQLGNRVVKYFDASKSLEPNRIELTLLSTTILLNTLTNLGGFWLWKNGYIAIRAEETILTFILDFFVLLLVMDMLMYFLHRVAHFSFIFKWLHGTHHEFRQPRPIDLFALNPLEDIAFGFLWLAFLMVYTSGWIAILTYLTVNVIFGITGHLGLEPVPEEKRKSWWYRFFCFSAFHHRHHAEDNCNFGFYTTLWDRIFGTLKL